MTRTLIPFALMVALLSTARAEKPKPAEPEAAWHVDDDEVFDQFMAKLRGLAKGDKCLPSGKLQNLVSGDRTTRLTPTRPAADRLDPEDVYRKALPSVFLIGSVLPDDEADDKDKDKDKDGKRKPDEKGKDDKADKGKADGYLDGRMATAWVLAADGVLVTNWHVFDGVEDGEAFGVMDHKGNAFPLTDILAVNRGADLAVVRVAATGLTPLPVADRPAAVGAWVGVLGHPGDRYFTFTQGGVTRYSKARREDKPAERWMAISADYAYGSSGSPVLDRTGTVVGMAALTESLDYPDAEPMPPEKPVEVRRRRQQPGDKPKEPDPKAKPDEPPAARGSSLQMVIKLAVPAGEIRKAVWAK